MSDFDRLDDVVDQYLRHLEEGTTPPSLYGLTNEEKAQAEAVFRLLRACRSSEAPIPALEDDPVAVELGLVTAPSGTIRLRGPQVKAARLASKLTIDAVAERLSARGHAVDFADILDIQLAAVLEVDRAMATELAKVLQVPLDRITEGAGLRSIEPLDAFLRSKAFRDEVSVWARSHDRPVPQAQTHFSNLLAKAAARSSGRPDAAEWMGMLRTLLDAHEP